MSFFKYLYRFDAGSQLVWGLDPGIVYVIKNVYMTAANVDENCNGIKLYLRSLDNEYLQFELGLIPLVACCNDRNLPNLNLPLRNDYNPYLGYLDGEMPSRAIVIIEYDKVPMEQFAKDSGIVGGTI